MFTNDKTNKITNKEMLEWIDECDGLENE